MSLDSIINVGIIRNPINWVIVILMVGLGALMIHLVHPTQADQGS